MALSAFILLEPLGFHSAALTKDTGSPHSSQGRPGMQRPTSSLPLGPAHFHGLQPLCHRGHLNPVPALLLTNQMASEAGCPLAIVSISLSTDGVGLSVKPPE